MDTHTIPTPDEIDAVIFDMIAAEAAQVPDGQPGRSVVQRSL
jgi:hypothetical protein